MKVCTTVSIFIIEIFASFKLSPVDVCHRPLVTDSRGAAGK